ncbi:hypothetical protein NKH77_28745 [Streptomyces sp. M19]
MDRREPRHRRIAPTRQFQTEQRPRRLNRLGDLLTTLVGRPGRQPHRRRQLIRQLIRPLDIPRILRLRLVEAVPAGRADVLVEPDHARLDALSDLTDREPTQEQRVRIQQHRRPETLLQQELLHQHMHVHTTVGIRERLKDLKRTSHPGNGPQLLLRPDRDRHLTVVTVQRGLHRRTRLTRPVVDRDLTTVLPMVEDTPRPHTRGRGCLISNNNGRPNNTSSAMSAANASEPVPRIVVRPSSRADQAITVFRPTPGTR